MRGVGTRVSPTTGFQAPQYAKPTRAHKRTGAKGVFGSISSQAKERVSESEAGHKSVPYTSRRSLGLAFRHGRAKGSALVDRARAQKK